MSDNSFFISSAQNAKFKLWESLLTSKGRRKESLFILSGEKIIDDFITDGTVEKYQVQSILIPKNFSSDSLAAWKKKWGLESPKLAFTLDSNLFKELDLVGTNFPLFVCQLPTEISSNQLTTPQGLELGLPLTDPANMGALCRTALSFGVQKIWLTPTACDPFHPKALRASSGGILKLNFVYLTTNEFTATNDDFGLDLNGKNIYELIWPQNVRLWLGEEGQGLKNAFLKKNTIHIPIKGMESLNATVAGSIAIFSYSQRFYKI